MKFYRVDPLYNGLYAVQKRTWGFWHTLRKYPSRSDALIHCESLNRSELNTREQAKLRRMDFVRRFIGEE